MEGTKERHCLRCLLEEIDPKAYARDIQRILDHMEPGERAGEDIRKGPPCGRDTVPTASGRAGAGKGRRDDEQRGQPHS